MVRCRAMRTTVVALLLAALTASAGAQVQLVIKRDGTKIIANVSDGAGGHTNDWSWLARKHDRRSIYDVYIERYAAQYDVDPVLVRAIIQVESDFNPNCVSNKGARGLMQLMPETAREYGVKRVHDPEENIRAGIRHFAKMMALFRNDLRRALAAYNAGEGAVLKYGGIPPYAETTTYVRRALTVYYGRPYDAPYSIAGRRGGPKLKGGFGRGMVPPVAAAAMLPGMKILGTQW